MKKEQEMKRARVRKAYLERAQEHELSGNRTAAYDCYQKAVDITPQIAFQLVKVLQQEHIDYIVAPYEADAQLAFLSLNGYVDLVITEDSDLIPFGCMKVLFKMDKSGRGVEFQYEDLAKNRDLDFTSYSKQMLLEMCILSGCDYLPSLPGMGVKRAHGLMRRFRNYRKVIKHLRYNAVCVPSDYEDMFTQAVLTFQHQWVYDPIHESIVHLNQLPADLTMNLDFLGPPISQKLGQAIARGEIDPITRKAFKLVNLQGMTPELKSSPSKTGRSNAAQRRHLDLPVQKNLLTKYYVPASDEAKRQFKAPRNNMPSDKTFERCSVEAEEDGFKEIQPLSESSDLKASTEVTKSCSSPDFSFSKCEEDQLLSFLDSKMSQTASMDSPDLNLSGHRLSTTSMLRKSFFQKSGSGSCVIKSAYFAKRKNVDQKTTNPVIGPPVTEDDTFDWHFERLSHLLEQDDSENKSLADNATDNFESMPDEHSQDCSCSGSHNKLVGKSVDYITAGKKKHIPSFSSKLLAENVQVVRFGSDVSHIEQYASIARKSMDRFVSTIAPFHFSATGARASGLRKPIKSVLSEKGSRFCARKRKSAEDLNKFACAPLICRTPLGQRDSVPGAMGDAGCFLAGKELKMGHF